MLRRVLVGLLAGTTAACGSARVAPKAFPDPPAVERARPAAAAARHIDGHAVVDTALGLRGVPYRDGGSDPSGFDCSGFVQYVFARHGLTLPREVKDQFTVGRKVSRSKVRAGDLLFFTTTARGPSHVGLAVGDGRFVHAPSERGVVRVESVRDGYWARRLIGAKRLR